MKNFFQGFSRRPLNRREVTIFGSIILLSVLMVGGIIAVTRFLPSASELHQTFTVNGKLTYAEGEAQSNNVIITVAGQATPTPTPTGTTISTPTPIPTSTGGVSPSPTPVISSTPSPTPTSTSVPIIATDLAITKTHVGNFTAGKKGTYSITVTNKGAIKTADATLIDFLPSGLAYNSAEGAGWNCAINSQTVTCVHPGDIVPHSTSTVTLIVDVGAAAVPTITNQITVTSTTPDTDATNNTSYDATIVNASADLSLSKTHSTEFVVGQESLYSLTVLNFGPTATTGTITVTDRLPDGVTYISADGAGWSCSPTNASGSANQLVVCSRTNSLAFHGSSTITFVVKPTATGSISNTATVQSSDDTSTSNNTATDTTIVTSTPVSTATPTPVPVVPQAPPKTGKKSWWFWWW